MDPLTGLGVAGAGYLLMKGAQSRASQPSDGAGDNGERLLTPGELAVFVGGIVQATQDSPFVSVDGTSKDVEAVLKQKVSEMSLSVVSAIITAVAMAGLLVFFAFVEVERLSRGRKWYAEQLLAMARAATGAVGVALTPIGLPNNQRNDLADLYGYYVARGFNRANIAHWSNRLGNLFDTLSGLPTEQVLGYWADRAVVLPETSYVESHLMRIPGMPRIAAESEGSLEFKMLGPSTDAEVKARLGSLWPSSFEAVADFVGRAIACTGLYSIASPPNERFLVMHGCIGNNQETAPAAIGFGGVPLYTVLNQDAGVIVDGTGRTSLFWLFRESEKTQRAVVKESK